MTRRLFRPKNAPEQLGISLSQFWIVVKAGKLSTFKEGNCTFITEDEIERYIASILPTAKRKAA